MIDAVSRGAHTPTTEEVTSYILLGEGDFTYSLDACRYVAAAASAASSSSSSSAAAAASATAAAAVHQIVHR